MNTDLRVYFLAFTLRKLCVCLSLLLAMCAAQASLAQSYPAKPIKIIVPVAAGGGTDFSARLIAQKLTESWNIPVIVENRPGGGGNVGVEAAVKSEPDGYTLVMPITSFPVNPSMYSKLPFDIASSLTCTIWRLNLNKIVPSFPSIRGFDKMCFFFWLLVLRDC